MLTSSSDVRPRLHEQLAACAYPGYVYGYPHKKAYRPLAPVPLEQAWRDEDRSRLFAYVHVPFCNQRCSFCNLFTLTPGDRSGVGPYLDALTRQMDVCAHRLPAHFSRLYIGGGTPTYLDAGELRRLVGGLRSILGIDPARTHGCIECSPETLDEEKVATLAELGFRRISLGVQSLVEDELNAVNRRFDFAAHAHAIGLIAKAGFPRFNIDLIYGLPGQSLSSWRSSLEQAIDTPANSLFLYPLYVRPLTGLGRRSSLDAPGTHQMAAMYDFAVERLELAGYRQITMRQFRRDEPEADDGYRCQSDGMLGLGAGARSYTAALHYSTPWKMVARNIRAVIDDYVCSSHETITHGFRLDADERRRRSVIQGLLYDGLDAEEALAFPEEFAALRDEGLVRGGEWLTLTARGVRHADVVGGLFFSPRVRALMDDYEYDT
jgi:oxygen-independent coproporphyrinogen III oxidase